MKRPIIVSILGVILSLLLLEVVLRIIPPKKLGIDLDTYLDERIFDPGEAFKNKPFVSRVWTGLGAPTIWTFNNIGFRDRPVSLERPHADTYRIVVVGDSMIMGLGVEDYQALPRRIEISLRDKLVGKPIVEVINLGLWGRGPQEYENAIKEFVPKLKPDMVIYGLHDNDVIGAVAFKNNEKYFALKSIPDKIFPYPINQFLERYSRLYLLLVSRYYTFVERFSKGTKNLEVEYNEGWPLAFDAILSSKIYSEKYKAKFILLGMPDVLEFNSHTPDIWHNRINMLTDFSNKNGINYLELAPYIKKLNYKKDVYISDGKGSYDTHFNVRGNELMGGVIADYILSSKLIP